MWSRGQVQEPELCSPFTVFSLCNSTTLWSSRVRPWCRSQVLHTGQPSQRAASLLKHSSLWRQSHTLISNASPLVPFVIICYLLHHSPSGMDTTVFPLRPCGFSRLTRLLISSALGWEPGLLPLGFPGAKQSMRVQYNCSSWDGKADVTHLTCRKNDFYQRMNKTWPFCINSAHFFSPTKWW